MDVMFCFECSKYRCQKFCFINGRLYIADPVGKRGFFDLYSADKKTVKALRSGIPRKKLKFLTCAEAQSLKFFLDMLNL